MKRIVICCDGTWNELDYRERPTTNVVKMAQSICLSDDAGGAPVEQIVFYDEGVGTLEGERIDGGGFGDGLNQNVIDAYTFLVFNYNPGDEIFIFGFSRGAYTARSLVGMIRNSGVVRRELAPYIPQAFDLYADEKLHPDSAACWSFRDKTGYDGWWVSRTRLPDGSYNSEPSGFDRHKQHTVAYLGVWDTVGSLGVPGVFNAVAGRRENAGFHDLILTSIVERARHAVAIDERRRVFSPSLWKREKLDLLNGGFDEADGDRYQQKWFPGDHGSVGGGGDLTGLSDQALQWVAEGASLNGASLAYDKQFSNVNHTVRGKNKRGKEIAKEIRFQPDGQAPLQNISDDYRREHIGAFGRLMNFAMGAAVSDRLALLQDLEDVSPEARSYRGFEGENQDYVRELRERLRAYTRFRRSDINNAFPGISEPDDD
ncbi:MAG: DUF2235 domain-containing protein [Pseudomonadota bacterium]